MTGVREHGVRRVLQVAYELDISASSLQFLKRKSEGFSLVVMVQPRLKKASNPCGVANMAKSLHKKVLIFFGITIVCVILAL